MAIAVLPLRQRLWTFGALALLSALVHDINHVRRGEAHDLLWVCNVAPLLLGVGCFFRVRVLVSIAALWLSVGTPLWLLDVAGGGGWMVTTLFPHVLCPVLAFLAVRELGLPKFGWLFATGLLVVLYGVTRLATPPSANVNIAFAVWKGWEKYFPRYDVYLGLTLAAETLTFFLMHKILERWVAKRTPILKEVRA